MYQGIHHSVVFKQWVRRLKMTIVDVVGIVSAIPSFLGGAYCLPASGLTLTIFSSFSSFFLFFLDFHA
jgi:ribulose 1,5-bisphosphate synthetase/thiazole synthase